MFKQIPAEYEQEILITLSHFPELKTTHIRFVPASNATVPYGTKPTFLSCFRKPEHRVYSITLLTEAEPPLLQVLFKNLNSSMRKAVIAHELSHVIQYQKCKYPTQLLKLLSKFIFSSERRKLERAADKSAIRHGFGKELLEHATFIRTVPGYLKKRPEINKEYLLPGEISYLLDHPGRLDAA